MATRAAAELTGQAEHSLMPALETGSARPGPTRTGRRAGLDRARSRQRFVAALHEHPITGSGFPLLPPANEPRGSTFIDLAMFTRDQSFLH